MLLGAENNLSSQKQINMRGTGAKWRNKAEQDSILETLQKNWIIIQGNDREKISSSGEPKAIIKSP